MRKLKTLPAVLCVLAAVTTRVEAAVLFENTGTLMGWSRVYVQQQGTNTMESAPTFEGPSAIRSTQTFVVADGRGYHSERVMFDIQKNGQDYYYGLALYLPPELGVSQPERSRFSNGHSKTPAAAVLGS